MDTIKEIIEQLAQNPVVISVISTILAFVATNVGTIIIFVIKLIGMKKNQIKAQEENSRIIEALNAKYNNRLTELEKKIDAKLEKVEKAVLDKVQELDTAREQLITDESISIQAALAEAKAALSKE